MPFKSEKQRRLLWAKHPEIARRWAHEYPGQKNLPMYANQGEEEPAPDKEKAAFTFPGKKLTFPLFTSFFPNTGSPMKQADSVQKYIEIPHSDEPTYAGQEHAEVAESGKPVQDGEDSRSTDEKIEESPLLKKLSAVLSRPLLQFLEDEKATLEARQSAKVPQNANLKQYPIASPTIPPPMGMAQAPAQPAPQPAPQQPARPAQAQALGKGAGPTANPIKSFGPLSASGQINGNAAFGVKNSPDSLKTAASDYLGKITNMDFPMHPDPEDLDLEEDERAKTAVDTSAGPPPKPKKKAPPQHNNYMLHAGLLSGLILSKATRAGYRQYQNQESEQMHYSPDSYHQTDRPDMNNDVKYAAFEFGQKMAAYRALSDIQAGAGPGQIQDAVMRFNQLRALVRPDTETLKDRGLSRGGFQHELRRITKGSQGQDKYNLSQMAPNPGLRAAIAGAAGLAGTGALAYMNGAEGLGAGLAGTGLAAGGAYLHGMHQRKNFRNTSKLLKDYGLLKPELLRQAYPLLADNYRAG